MALGREVPYPVSYKGQHNYGTLQCNLQWRPISVARGAVSFGYGLGDALPGREAGCGCLPSGTSPDSFGLCFAVDRPWSDAGWGCGPWPSDISRTFCCCLTLAPPPRPTLLGGDTGAGVEWWMEGCRGGCSCPSGVGWGVCRLEGMFSPGL